MKKIIALVMTMVFCFFACVGMSATEADETVITVNNVDVKFSAGSGLSLAEKQLIAERIVWSGKDDGTETYGLMCTLFGHDYTTENVTTTTHCKSQTPPRCLVEMWSLEVCTRCDDVVETLTGSYYIDCCD